MLEQCARAIAKVDHNGRVAEEGYWSNPDTGCNAYRVMARAVLTTLREPTPGMIEAGRRAVKAHAMLNPLSDVVTLADAAWIAMIDEAMGEG